MSHCRSRRPATALILGIPAAFGAAALAQQPADSTILEEVTVSAQRRDENIQTVPVAVTAIDPAVIERRQILDTKQIVFNVPNLTGNSNVGQSTATTFFMRGVGTTENLATADTSVGLYVDDVYVARQAVNNFNLADIERIEVLRGPQGTLYGRNTNGGAIRIVTKKPSAEPEFAVRGSYGNYSRWDLKLSGNTPITDKVFVRANFLTQQGDGYIRNTTLGKDVNDLDYVGGRIALRALPSEQLDINFVVDYSQDKTHGNYSSDIAGVLRPSTGDLRRVVTGNNSTGDAKTSGATLSMAWDFSDAAKLTSITGYRQTKQVLNIDLSDQPVSLYNLLQTQDADQLSQEFQLSADLGDAFRVVGGLYYFKETADATVTDLTRASAVAAQSRFAKVFDTDIESYAAFGQLEYRLGAFTLLAAARYTSEDRSLSIVQTSSRGGPAVQFRHRGTARAPGGWPEHLSRPLVQRHDAEVRHQLADQRRPVRLRLVHRGLPLGRLDGPGAALRPVHQLQPRAGRVDRGGPEDHAGWRPGPLEHVGVLDGLQRSLQYADDQRRLLRADRGRED